MPSSASTLLVVDGTIYSSSSGVFFFASPGRSAAMYKKIKMSETKLKM